eukprot:m.153734 g.153734  ORF g.153734 m.153734 type:complete len:136 (+) comp30845_c0_seq1:150-557(+)
MLVFGEKPKQKTTNQTKTKKFTKQTKKQVKTKQNQTTNTTKQTKPKNKQNKQNPTVVLGVLLIFQFHCHLYCVLYMYHDVAFASGPFVFAFVLVFASHFSLHLRLHTWRPPCQMQAFHVAKNRDYLCDSLRQVDH